jgi:hypothetical protein
MFLGYLAFGGMLAVQFLAVVAALKWNADMSATNGLHRGTRITGNECSAGCGTDSAIQSAAVLEHFRAKHVLELENVENRISQEDNDRGGRLALPFSKRRI